MFFGNLSDENVHHFPIRLWQNEQTNQVLAQRIEDSQEDGGEADLVVFIALDIIQVIDLEYVVEGCTGMEGFCGTLMFEAVVVSCLYDKLLKLKLSLTGQGERDGIHTN